MDTPSTRCDDAGEGFLLNPDDILRARLSGNGPLAIGGTSHCADSWALSGLRRELAEMNCGIGACWTKTEILRVLAAAPWTIWAKARQGRSRYANAAYARATRATSVADEIDRRSRNCSQQRRQPPNDNGRALSEKRGLHGTAADRGRGERRIYDVHALNIGDGSAGIADRRRRSNPRGARRL